MILSSHYLYSPTYWSVFSIFLDPVHPSENASPLFSLFLLQKKRTRATGQNDFDHKVYYLKFLGLSCKSHLHI